MWMIFITFLQRRSNDMLGVRWSKIAFLALVECPCYVAMSRA